MGSATSETAGQHIAANADAFREAMARVCTPVSVVTVVTNGRPHGTTVSAFASLSVDPPMILVSLDRASDLLALVKASGVFGMNVLSRSQTALAFQFAVKGREKFAGVSWVQQDGAARLAGASVWVACEVADIVPGGDHEIVLGHVIAVDSADAEPLTYHARVFGSHRAIEPPEE